MKNLKTLFNCGIDIEINGVQINSKNVKSGDLFICRKGLNSDAHDFINEAIKNGAVALVCNKKVNVNVPIIIVNNVNDKIPDIMDWYYGKLNDKFKNIIGVTGTAGKTTVCNIINKISNYKSNCASLGTNGIILNNYSFEDFKERNTTFPINVLYEISEKLFNDKIENLVIESSSYGLKQNRIGNTMYDIAIVTNFSKAHIGEHNDINDYLESKLKIISKIKKEGYLILNIDDKTFDIFKEKCTSNVVTFGKNEKADLCICDIKESLEGTTFSILYKNVKHKVRTKLLGLGNVYNLCASFLACTLMGVSLEDCTYAIKNFYIKGRMENYKNVIIDFAVTVDALRKNMEFLSRNKKGKIISVVGRLEGKDINEYNDFGEISSYFSNYVIFTTDKNKTNTSLSTYNMAKSSLNNNYEVILDRKLAIEKGIKIKGENDILYIVGCEYLYKNKNEECVNPYNVIDSFS